MGGGMAGPMDPEKEPWVNKIKVYQKSSPEAKEAWSQFIGPTKDPARASLEKLTEFCTTFGIM